MTVLLASLPLQLVCHLMVTGNLSVSTEKNNSVKTQREIPPAISPEDYVPITSVGFAYKIHNVSRSWNEARKLCILEGGSLAIVDSWAKQIFISEMNNLNSSLFVGIHNMFNSGEWIRADNGLPVTSVPWASGSPVGTGNCLALFRDGSGIGDTKCSYGFPFVCEIPIDKN